jgi:hypothetical protein
MAYIFLLGLKRNEPVDYAERYQYVQWCGGKHRAVLGQECEYWQKADRRKTMKEVCRSSIAVIHQLHVRSRLHLEASYRTLSILNLDSLRAVPFTQPNSA